MSKSYKDNALNIHILQFTKLKFEIFVPRTRNDVKHYFVTTCQHEQSA